MPPFNQIIRRFPPPIQPTSAGLQFRRSGRAGTFVTASNSFGVRVLEKLTANDRPGSESNPFISPLSLSLALTMTMEGAGGETRKQMLSVLDYPANAVPAAIDSEVTTLLSAYGSKRIARYAPMRIASGLWPNLAIPVSDGRLSPQFAAHAADVFAATAEAVDFSTASGARRINAWTNEHTNGNIPNILPDAPLPNAELVLTNAVYFKANWKTRFNERMTVPETFTLVSGAQRRIPMMRQVLDMPFLLGDGFSAVEIPYFDDRFSLVIVLPDRGTNLRAMTARSLSAITGPNDHPPRFGFARVDLHLPRFRIAYDAGNLDRLLMSLGMTLPFSRHADFRPMGYPGAAIAAVLHKTTLDVDEAGSEATATTAVVMMRSISMAEMEQPVVVPFIVDRPFFCAVRDNAMGDLLFLGRITDPG